MRTLCLLFRIFFISTPPALALEPNFRSILEEVKKREAEASRQYISNLKNKSLNISASNDQNILHLAQGLDAFENNPDLADSHFFKAEEQSSKDDPLRTTIQFLRAKLKFREKKYDECQKILEKILSTKPPISWKKNALNLLVEALYSAEKYDALAKTFNQYAGNFSFDAKDEKIARFAAETFGKRGEFSKEIIFLEELSRMYPTTPDSRWAFKRLNDLSCEHRTKDRYYFSSDVLLGISRNLSLDDSLRDLILSLITAQVRINRKNPALLGKEELAEFLFQLRFYKEAAEQNISLYHDLDLNKDQKKRGHFAFQAGRSFFRNQDLIQSASWFSRFIEENPHHPLIYKARELLADCFKHLELQKEALQQFSISMSMRKQENLNWENFWVSYRSKNLELALSFLENQQQPLTRSDDDPLSILYWHGKILDKLGRAVEANEKFRVLLESSGDSYYAHLLISEYPELVNRSRELTEKSNEKNSRFSLAAKTFPPILHIKEKTYNEVSEELMRSNRNLKTIDDLIQLGLKDLAALELAKIERRQLGDPQHFFYLTALANHLGDYQSSRQIRFLDSAQIKNAPLRFEDYLIHEEKHLAEWKIYYPLAFEDIVFPISEEVGLDPLFLLSIMRSESFYQKNAISSVGAIGLLQLMPYTGLKIAKLLSDFSFEVKNLSEPEINITYSGFYFAKLLRYFQKNLAVATAAYNAGPNVVNHWIDWCKGCSTPEFIESIPYRETRRYVREVMKTYAHYRRLYESHTTFPSMENLPKNRSDAADIF